MAAHASSKAIIFGSDSLSEMSIDGDGLNEVCILINKVQRHLGRATAD